MVCRCCVVSVGDALEKNGCAGKCGPQQDALLPVGSEKTCCRDGNPETEAVEAVEEAGPEAFACRAPQPQEQIPRAVFGIEQMRDAPYGQDGDCGPIDLRRHEGRSSAGDGCRPAADGAVVWLEIDHCHGQIGLTPDELRGVVIPVSRLGICRVASGWIEGAAIAVEGEAVASSR